jgi:putative FmdB family regulatory protein
MPLYEYKCAQCGTVTEVIQKVSDAPLAVCAQCGGPLHKQVTSPAIQFKGSGWYVTDYAGKKPAETPSKTEKPSAPKKDESQKETKSAKKSPSTTPAH